MNISDVLRKENTEAKLKISNRDELLSAVADVACRDPQLEGMHAQVLKNLREREELGSTALGAGVAVPHCRISGLRSFVAGIVTTAKKLDYDAADNEKVDIFPFVIGPEDNPKEHLRVLSGMARLLRNPDTRKAIRSAASGSELFQLITGLDAEGVSGAPSDTACSMKMLHVFVRNEELFNDILQVFASGEFLGAMVLEAHESTEYMSGIPVFAGFWNSDLNTFNRIITAVVKGSLVNQTIRNIEYVCGALKDQSDVMVTVSDLHHAIGSLDY